MSHFAVLWKNTEISLAELKLVNPQNIDHHRKNIITFSTDKEKLLNQLGGIIKWGRVVHKDKLAKFLEWKKILGTEEKELWISLKKEFKIKRFKLVSPQKTDKDVRDKWVEIIMINNLYGVVLGNQDIPLYENVDFKKPSRSMQMGMMPAKLTHIMINLGLQQASKIKGEFAIYDPFAGSGTTGMLANHIINFPRRKNNYFCDKTKTIDFFQQDITKKMNPSLRAKWNESVGISKKQNLIIVTEWRLGPIITRNSTDRDIIDAESSQLSHTISVTII